MYGHEPAGSGAAGAPDDHHRDLHRDLREGLQLEPNHSHYVFADHGLDVDEAGGARRAAQVVRTQPAHRMAHAARTRRRARMHSHEARGTKHEARSTKHEARSTKHEARSTKHEARSTNVSSAAATYWL